MEFKLQAENDKGGLHGNSEGRAPKEREKEALALGPFCIEFCMATKRS